MWTAVEETDMKAILAVMNTNQVVVKIRPEKNLGPCGIWTHDLCDSGVVFHQLSLQAQLGAGHHVCSK